MENIVDFPVADKLVSFSFSEHAPHGVAHNMEASSCDLMSAFGWFEPHVALAAVRRKLKRSIVSITIASWASI